MPCQHSVEIDINDAEGQSFADIGFRPQNSQQKSILFSFVQLLSKPIFHSLIKNLLFVVMQIGLSLLSTQNLEWIIKGQWNEISGSYITLNQLHFCPFTIISLNHKSPVNQNHLL